MPKLPKDIQALEREISRLQRETAELRDTHETYQALFDHRFNCIYLHDLAGNFIDANDAALNLLGYERGDIPGLNFGDLMGADQLAKALTVLEEIKESGHEQKAVEYELQRKDGRRIWIETGGSLIYHNGKPRAVIGVARNITARKQAEKALLVREQELENKTRNLADTNTALQVLLEKREMDKKALENRMLSNARQLIEPYLLAIKQTPLSARQSNLLGIIETNLDEILAPFAPGLASAYYQLTPKEIQVANLIKHGKTTKEIADIMGLAVKTIEYHRKKIRFKLGLKNAKANLQSHLMYILKP